MYACFDDDRVVGVYGLNQSRSLLAVWQLSSLNGCGIVGALLWPLSMLLMLYGVGDAALQNCDGLTILCPQPTKSRVALFACHCWERGVALV